MTVFGEIKAIQSRKIRIKRFEKSINKRFIILLFLVYPKLKYTNSSKLVFMNDFDV